MFFFRDISEEEWLEPETRVEALNMIQNYIFG